MVLAAALVLLLQDTIPLLPAERAPRFDGRADSAEYGAASVVLERPAGAVPVWLRRDGAFVYLAARIADTSFYWGDDFVISLDTRGDGGSGPGHDDFQWYFRRALDSSVVYRGEAGKWRAPRDDPDWRLGASRSGGGWEVRVASDAAGWSLELRLEAGWFGEATTGLPRLALRTYDDAPQGWFPWPDPPGLPQPTIVERRPELWGVVRLDADPVSAPPR